MTAQFSVVSFSPDPEEVEHVHVALLFSERQWGMVFDPRFPKLTCIAPRFDPGLIQGYLQDFANDTASRPFAEVPALLSGRSSQFRASEPRALITDLTPSLVELLKTKYLAKAPHSHARGKLRNVRVELLLNGFLSERDIARVNVLRKPKPSDFLSGAATRLLADPKLRLVRVINGPADIVVLDGLDLQAPVGNLRTRAVKISYSYFEMKKIADEVARADGKKLHLASLLFNHSALNSEKRQHVVDVVRNYSDFIEDADHTTVAFGRVLTQAAPRLDVH